MTAHLRGTAAAVTVALACALSVSSCTGSPASEITYAVDGTLTTYNTNTVAGAASGGPQAFARVLTGFNYHGPDGQIVGDHDFGTIAVVGRAPLVLDYVISDKAVYSDGKPVTCDDLVLAWAAQSGRFPGFDAANQAGYREIATVDCAPGQKRARVSFAADRAFVDFGQLFAATSLMPSHVIADELGIDVTTRHLNNDGPNIDRIAQAWNSTWNLTPDLDLKRFPSSGPYKLDSVSDDGAVVLVANDKWWGAKPVTNKIIVQPARRRCAGPPQQRHRRRRRRRHRLIGRAQHARGLHPGRQPVRGYRAADLRRAGTDGRAARAARARAVHATRCDRPQRGGADRQHPPQSGDRGSGRSAPKPLGPNSSSRPTPTPPETHWAISRWRCGSATRPPMRDLPRPSGRSPSPARLRASPYRTSSSETTGPLALRNNEIDILLASTGGSTGSGSTGSSAMDAYDLHTGNGNNLSGYYEPADRRHHRRARGDRRPQGGGATARRGGAHPVGRRADAAVVPSAAHPDHIEEDVCGEQ